MAAILLGAAIGGVVLRDLPGADTTDVKGIQIQRSPTPSPDTVDCDAQPAFCSLNTERLEIAGGHLVSHTSSMHLERGESPHPTLATTSIPSGDGVTAQVGEPVQRLFVEFRIVNETRTTYSFPDGRLGLQMTRDGVVVDVTPVKAGTFELAPQTDPAGPPSEKRVTQEVPVAGDAVYEWRGFTIYSD